MTGLPTDPGVIVIGSCLRDPGQFWGAGPAVHAEALPPRPCTLCGDTGWINDIFYGATLGARCPCGGGA